MEEGKKEGFPTQVPGIRKYHFREVVQQVQPATCLTVGVLSADPVWCKERTKFANCPLTSVWHHDIEINKYM